MTTKPPGNLPINSKEWRDWYIAGREPGDVDTETQVEITSSTMGAESRIRALIDDPEIVWHQQFGAPNRVQPDAQCDCAMCVEEDSE